MSSESSVKSGQVDTLVTDGGASPTSEAAWRATFAAALRVIDHHRANLEARITIHRVRREEQRPSADTIGRELPG